MTMEKTDIEDRDRYYFLGIGGIGMSALARFCKQRGYDVGGYDRQRSELCIQLEKEGMDIHYDDVADNIPKAYVEKERTVVVYTPAIPVDSDEMTYFREKGFVIMKRAKLLGLLTRDMDGLCVAGTHGKTTTTNMISNILIQSKRGVNAFLGGIAKNWDTNLLVSKKTDKVVIEADEYDRSFLNLRPKIAVITATDPDHLDIYGTVEKMRDTFSDFTGLIKRGGALIVKKGVKLKVRTQDGVKVYTYSGRPATGGGKKCDFYATFVRKKNGTICFNLVSPLGNIRDIELGVPILINVEDAVAACAVAQLCGAKPEEIRLGINGFKGTKRRFETHYHKIGANDNGLSIKEDAQGEKRYIDDYAHHPMEIEKTLEAVRYLYPEARVCAIFQPHLYSRTRDLADGFAKALSMADDVILTDIYPAREAPIDGVSAKLILNKVTAKHKKLIKKEYLCEELDNHDFDILLTLGAGDIDKMIPEIAGYMVQRFG